MADFDVRRGDDADIPIAVALPQDSPSAPPESVDISNAAMVFTMKLARADGSSVHADTPAVRLTSDDTAEIEIYPQTGDNVGLMMVHLRGELTEFLKPGIYRWDVRMVLNGVRSTVAEGRIFLTGDVGSAEDRT